MPKKEKQIRLQPSPQNGHGAQGAPMLRARGTTTRRLRISTDVRYGVYYRFKLIPYIRLKGQWLKDAGFEPGGKVEVTVMPGELTIKVIG